MSTQDILQKIPHEQLPGLRDLLKVDWPKHIHACYLVENALKWRHKYPNEEYVTIYSPEGDWSDGTFIAFVAIRVHLPEVFVYTLDQTFTKLEYTLRTTKLIQWKDTPFFPAVRDDFFDVLAKVRTERVPMEFSVPSNVWWISKEESLQLDCRIPPELYIAELNHSHADTMNAVWPHRHPGSEKYIAKLLKLNGGIGLFHRETNELCAWVLKNAFNALGLLQTAEKYKRKGYGSIVTKIFSKRLAEEGYDPFGFVVRVNTPSRKLFTSNGFKEVASVTWMK